MNRFVVATIILLIATVLITVVYFKNMKPPGQETASVISSIPANSPVVLELNSEEGISDMVNDSSVFANVCGAQKLKELRVLQQRLLGNRVLQPYFTEAHVFVSLHPGTGNQTDYLLSIASNKKIGKDAYGQLSQGNDSLQIKPLEIAGKPGFVITIKGMDRPFYVINKEDNVFQGSFSKTLVVQCAQYNEKKHKPTFVQLSNQQHSDALAVLYVNNNNLEPLFDQLFAGRNPDIFRSFRLLDARSALTMNYRSDALMFSGVTQLDAGGPQSYLNLFARQEPVVNHLRDVFPSTTAYANLFSVSNPRRFAGDLDSWQKKAGINNEIVSLLQTIRNETGVRLREEFDNMLGNEFAVVTTRFQEKLGIIEVRNGSLLRPFMVNVSRMVTDDIGQFNYSKVPYYLLGDAFSAFRKPYFIIINNYLVLANTESELRAFEDSYNNLKFLSKTDAFNAFNELLAAKGNVTFFIHFKNAAQVLKRDLKPPFNTAFEQGNPGLKNYYAAAYQLIAADHNFYTNYCMKLARPDSTSSTGQ